MPVVALVSVEEVAAVPLLVLLGHHNSASFGSLA